MVGYSGLAEAPSAWTLQKQEQCHVDPRHYKPSTKQVLHVCTLCCYKFVGTGRGLPVEQTKCVCSCRKALLLSCSYLLWLHIMRKTSHMNDVKERFYCLVFVA